MTKESARKIAIAVPQNLLIEIMAETMANGLTVTPEYIIAKLKENGYHVAAAYASAVLADENKPKVVKLHKYGRRLY